ncbi:MAG: 3-hydroxybutyryl-CoA dehydrogenase [Rhodospirillales bacterium RIFCSPLOWO2_12_FULL_67_15]|nr:MAG: 3-hydroxybutyryl-CoA dehydrogenase [Rhodospirillales bacterium RIFCSPLOWO2_12_FULL_67_15]
MAKDIQNIGIVGAGQMGHGIALVCALAGFDVTMLDLTPEALDKGVKAIQRDLQREVDKKRLAQDKADAAVSRIKTTTAYADLKDRDLVIEAATEDEKIKKEIIKKVCPVLGPDAYLATNTSSISITRLGAGSDRPGKFVGMHFMNPVPRMELVELIRGIATEEETYRLIRELAVKLGKTPVNAEDFPAFLVNRILLPMLNEAVYTLYEGVGSVEAIDTAMKLGTHHPMGPFELADFIGLDVCLAVMQVLHEGLSDSKYRPCPLLVKYVEAGWLGRKTGRGFYDYSGPKPVPTR